MKTCTKCNLEKSLANFHKAARGKFGRSARCKVCMNTYYKENKAKIIQKVHDRYIENVEDRSKYNVQYRKDNKLALQQYFRKYHKKNQNKILRKVIKWRKENPVQYNLNMKAAAHRRRARIHQNGNNTLTAKEIKCLFERIKYCVYCGRGSNLTLDHIVPISKGGQNCLSNVTVACGSCNSKKSNKLNFNDLTITHSTFS